METYVQLFGSWSDFFVNCQNKRLKCSDWVSDTASMQACTGCTQTPPQKANSDNRGDQRWFNIQIVISIEAQMLFKSLQDKYIHVRKCLRLQHTLSFCICWGAQTEFPLFSDGFLQMLQQ